MTTFSLVPLLVETLSACGSMFVAAPDGTSIARGDENDDNDDEVEEEEEEDTKDALLR